MTPHEDSSNMPSDPDKALSIVRLIWGALLAGQLIFGAVVVVLIGMDMFEPAGPPLPWRSSSRSGPTAGPCVPAAAIPTAGSEGGRGFQP